MISIFVFCTIDVLVASARHQFPFLTNALRPIVVLIFLSSQRNQMKNIFVYVLRDISVVLFSTFLYISFCAIIFYYLFKFQLQGFTYFTSPGNTIYESIILMTTSNFPDVMLPAYNASRWNCLLFIGFLLMGLFFLLNVLLAIVFTNYKKRLQEKVEKKGEDRAKMISDYFDEYDKGNKGYLDLAETKKLFAMLLDLKWTRNRDRVTFKKIIKLIDIDGTKEIQKENLIELCM